MDFNWYNSLNKPLFTPPSWLFGPVWTTLYILIAISGIIIFKNGFKNKKIKPALKFFSLQLILNLIWSPIFFGLHQISLAFIIILFMWYFIYQTIKSFEKINKLASYLLYPYLIWVTIAGVLNLSVLLLN